MSAGRGGPTASTPHGRLERAPRVSGGPRGGCRGRSASCSSVGATCFFVGPFPGFVELVGSGVDGMVFFVGSIFFTSAAFLQWLETINADPDPIAHRARFRVLSFEPHRIDWWSSGVQLVGTVLFNANTFHALQEALDAESYDRLVWTPDAIGSACFLVSGYLAYVEVCGGYLWTRRRTLEWKIAAVNLLGCIAFGISAIAAFWGSLGRERPRPGRRQLLHGIRRSLLPRRRRPPTPRSSIGADVSRGRRRHRRAVTALPLPPRPAGARVVSPAACVLCPVNGHDLGRRVSPA